MNKPISIPGRALKINMVPVYGARDGVFGDDYIGDVNVSPPSEYSKDARGLSMWRVSVRFDRYPPSFHKTEANALKASRRFVRRYYTL